MGIRICEAHARAHLLDGGPLLVWEEKFAAIIPFLRPHSILVQVQLGPRVVSARAAPNCRPDNAPALNIYPARDDTILVLDGHSIRNHPHARAVLAQDGRCDRGACRVLQICGHQCAHAALGLRRIGGVATKGIGGSVARSRPKSVRARWRRAVKSELDPKSKLKEELFQRSADARVKIFFLIHLVQMYQEEYFVHLVHPSARRQLR